MLKTKARGGNPFGGPSQSLDGPGIITRSMRERQTLFLPHVSAEVAKAHGVDASELAVFEAIGLRSVIVVPFIVRGELTGGMVFATTAGPYNQADLRFAERYAFCVADCWRTPVSTRKRKKPFARATISFRSPRTSFERRSRAFVFSPRGSPRKPRKCLRAWWPS